MFNAAEEGKTLRTTMKGGTGNGLEIMLDIQQDEYLPVWGETGTHTYTQTNTVRPDHTMYTWAFPELSLVKHLSSFAGETLIILQVSD